MYLIGITGLIGSGKTTVLKKIMSYFDLEVAVGTFHIDDFEISMVPKEIDVVIIEGDISSLNHTVKLFKKLNMIIYVDTPEDICLVRLIKKNADIKSNHKLKQYLDVYESEIKPQYKRLSSLTKEKSDVIINNSTDSFNMNLTGVMDFIYKSTDLKSQHRAKPKIISPTFDSSLKLQMVGRLYVVSGPSGVGKTSVIKKLLQESKELNIERLVPYTTRKPRASEKYGDPYRFVQRDVFFELLEKQSFLQHFEDYGEHYGIPENEVTDKLMSGTSLVIDVSSKVLSQVKDKIPNLVSIYICPPKMASIMDHLTARNDDQHSAKKRYEKSKLELESASYNNYDYLIINDNLDRACEALKSIVFSTDLMLNSQLRRNADLFEKFKIHRELDKIIHVAKVDLDLDDFSIEKLSSLNNMTYKLTSNSNQKSYFLRLIGAINEEHSVFGVDEFKHLQQAEKLDLYPEIIHYDQQNYSYITRFMSDYEKVSAQQVKQSDQILSGIVEAMKKLHGSDPFQRDYSPLAFDEKSLYRMRQLHVNQTQDMDEIAIICHRIYDLLEKTCAQKTPCHNDMSIYNILYRFTDGDVMLTDWECSGNNDPFWDLAKFSVESNFTSTEDNKMFLRYFGKVTAEYHSRLTLYKLLVEYHLGIWAKLQSVKKIGIPFLHRKFEKMHIIRMDNCRKYIESRFFQEHVNITMSAVQVEGFKPPEFRMIFRGLSGGTFPIKIKQKSFTENNSSVFFKRNSNHNALPVTLDKPDADLTLLILKPSIPARNKIGEVISFIENNGFRVVGLKCKQLQSEEVELLYPQIENQVHRFDVLDLMTSGPLVLVALEAKNAVEKLCNMKGMTDPLKAKPNTLRKLFGVNVKWNAVHCSDDSISACREINLFFTEQELTRISPKKFLGMEKSW